MPLFFRRSRARPGAETLYAALVAQARAPAFYRDCGVPDTLEGRFEMLLLTACLFFRRLRSEDEASRRLGQKVFDVMFRDMDASLREIGIGDLTVPKKIRAMGEAFYGRAAVYDAALARGDAGELAVALARNIWTGDEDAALRQGAELARWALAAEVELARQDGGELVTRGPVLPAPELRELEGIGV